ncbi:hypothetical protein DFA_04679 [Cavenderia fasciculata]|uniref:Uncharacterized protein n=1 Tax=Cavenderia fasciculata TaxID=261658 RepID=F4PQ86_CACFS|nr:uncharacterized protein DFA_04679 [Cavenderia fasciculata]EGG22549.1 hypothetical protein DFA_04679 [Cavenderia fasciculata]|eukprot:XP_004360400.1 hypothetical protein DFA_04679 [Cavenderia fasciculata]
MIRSTNQQITSVLFKYIYIDKNERWGKGRKEMSSISLYCRRSIGTLFGQQNAFSLSANASNSLYRFGRARKVVGNPFLQEDDDEDFMEDSGDGEGDQQQKLSKGSLDKIKQRFTKIYKRPQPTTAKPSAEEQQLRDIIKSYAKYSQETAQKRDDEEKEKSHLQWEAIAELPEDLRKIALLVDTHDEAPMPIPTWTLTPPSKDPQSKIVWKKKDKLKVVKRSEEQLTGDLF